MRLLLDQGLPRGAANQLREHGIACEHVGEVGMSRAPDSEILARALAQNAVLVTLDADFHMILAASGAGGPSVIRLRLQGMKAPAVVKIIQDILAGFGSELNEGAVVTAKTGKTSCSKLPIGIRGRD